MQTVCLSGRHSQELLANKGCRLPLCFAQEPGGISDQPSAFVAVLPCEWVQTVCLSGQHVQEWLADKGWRHPLCFASKPSRTPTNRASLRLLLVRNRCKLCACLTGTHTRCFANKGLHLPPCFASEPSSRPIQQACGWSSVRHECTLFALPGIRRCCLRTVVATFGFALHKSRPDTSTNRASLRLLISARWMQTVCLFGRHSRGNHCRQRLAPSSLLCTGAVRGVRPIEQACGCSSVRD